MRNVSGVLRATLVALLAGGAAVAATQVTGGVQLAAPHERAGLPESSDVLVDEATLVCPGQQRLGADGSREVEGRVTTAVAAAPLAALTAVKGVSLDGTGSVGLETGTDAKVLATGTDRGPATTATLASLGPVLARASGPLAPGVAATQTWARGGDDDRGVAVTPCQLPSSDVWLVGGGAGPSRTERLVVTNPGANAVTVSFDVYGVGGPVAAAEGRSLSVAPRSREVVALDSIAPDEAGPAVHVIATGGVVSAVLSDAWIDGATGRGVDDATRTLAPSRGLVVPGVDAAGAVTLRVLNPGDTEALVQVRILTAKGPVQPPELRAVRVPAGSTKDVPLALETGATALRLTADQPVVASAYVERRAATGADRMSDFGWAPATAPIRGVGGVLLPGLDVAGARKTLLLAGGDAPAQATVVIGTGSAERSVTVDVPADSATSVPLDKADRVWVAPQRGDVRAAVTVAGTDGPAPWFTLVPVFGSPVTALAVPVRQVGS